MSPSSLNRWFFLTAAVGITSAVIFFSVLLKGEGKSKILPGLGRVENFSLTDSNGKEFKSQSLNGKVWVADFIFTTCSGVCPLMTQAMASLHRSYLLVDGVRFVSISVNPETDSPKTLTAFAKKYEANTNKWHFLTGQAETIKKLAVESFKVGSVEEPIFHSDRLILVDRHGFIRGYYTGTENKDVNVLFKDIARLLKER